MKTEVHYIGVDMGLMNDFSSMFVLKRTGVRDVQVVADVSIRIKTPEDIKRFDEEFGKLKKKYNAKSLG